MKYILSFVFALLLFSCSNTEEKPKQEIQGIGNFQLADTEGYISSVDPGWNMTTSEKIIFPDPITSWTLFNEKGDTTVLTFRNETRVFTYVVPVIDTVVRPKKTTVPIPNPPKDTTTTPPQSVGYTLAYSNDYEQASDINTNQLGAGKQTVFEGRGVFWSEYKIGSPSISSGYRSEQEYNTRYFPEANPTEGKLSVDMYFKEFSTGWGGHCLQWHPNNNQSAVFLLSHTDGKFNFARSLDGSNFYQSGSLKTIEKGKWYKVEIQFKWSGGSDGYLRAYVDGVLCMNYTGRTQDGSGKPYLKVGQNYFSNKLGGIILYDNLFVYKK